MPNISKLKTENVKRPDQNLPKMNPVNIAPKNINIKNNLNIPTLNTKIKAPSYTPLQHDEGVDNSMESYDFSDGGDKRLSMLQDTQRQ